MESHAQAGGRIWAIKIGDQPSKLKGKIMSSINKAILIGHLGTDMEVKIINNGQGKAGSFSLATDASYKNKETGEWVERADWHRIVTYQTGLIDALEGKLNKGRLVYVEGTIKTRNYKDKEGIERSITEILVDSHGTIRLLDRPKDNAGNDEEPGEESMNGDDSFHE